MIVFHNAWQYYNDRFGITTLGFVERNPGQEPNPQQIAQLVDWRKQHGVRAVFSEPEYSPKLLNSIAQGAGIGVVENLYDDSIGTDPRVRDYISMLEYDTNIIVGFAEVSDPARPSTAALRASAQDDMKGSASAQDDMRGRASAQPFDCAASGRSAQDDIGTEAVSARSLTVRYDDFTALSDATLTVHFGEALGVVGPNGSGKSTLLKTLAGLLSPSGGELSVLGTKPRRLPPGSIAYVPQIEAVDLDVPRNRARRRSDGTLPAPAVLAPFRRARPRQSSRTPSKR